MIVQTKDLACKKVAEFIARDCCLNGLVDASVARCFSFVGPGLPTDLHYAVGNFVADAITTRKITIEGNGLTQRSYMDLGYGSLCDTYLMAGLERIMCRLE